MKAEKFLILTLWWGVGAEQGMKRKLECFLRGDANHKANIPGHLL